MEIASKYQKEATTTIQLETIIKFQISNSLNQSNVEHCIHSIQFNSIQLQTSISLKNKLFECQRERMYVYTLYGKIARISLNQQKQKKCRKLNEIINEFPFRAILRK